MCKFFWPLPVCLTSLVVRLLSLEDDVSQSLTAQGSRLPGNLAAQSVAAAQAVAVQAAMAAQVAALEQLREKLDSGEPPEKKMALPSEDHQRLLQRALQQNLLAMSTQMPMNIRINSQGNKALDISQTVTSTIILASEKSMTEEWTSSSACENLNNSAVISW